jgi:hypothetical protein
LSAPEDEGLLGASESQQTLIAIVSKLQEEQLIKLFSFICDWNTTSGESTKNAYLPRYLWCFSANSTAAQEVLLAIFSSKAAQDLLKTKGIKRTAETLLLYSHRHYDRLSRLLQVQ